MVCLYTSAREERTAGKKYYQTFILVGKNVGNLLSSFSRALAILAKGDPGLTMELRNRDALRYSTIRFDLGNVGKQIKLDLNVGEIIFQILSKLLENTIVTPRTVTIHTHIIYVIINDDNPGNNGIAIRRPYILKIDIISVEKCIVF